MSEVREEYRASIDPPDHRSRLIRKLHWIGWVEDAEHLRQALATLEPERSVYPRPGAARCMKRPDVKIKPGARLT
jgi:hypothetical protein